MSPLDFFHMSIWERLQIKGLGTGGSSIRNLAGDWTITFRVDQSGCFPLADPASNTLKFPTGAGRDALQGFPEASWE